jgi:hypothetical protein
MHVWRKVIMKIKNMVAAFAASALTLSALAVPAFAEKTILNANENGNYTVNVKELDMAKIVGIKAEITAAEGWNETGMGGGLAFNADSKGTGWTQFEWGITGEGTDAKNTAGVTIAGSDGKFTITYMGDTCYFADTDEWDGIAIAAWWGSDFTVDSLIPLDANGNEVGAKSASVEETTTAAETTTTTTTTAAGTTTTTTSKKDDKKTDSAKTGDAGVGVIVAALGLAGAAAFATRKKH